MASIDDIRAERIKKLDLLQAVGMDAYPATTNRTHSIATIHDAFDNFSHSSDAVVLAGRVRSFRQHGGVIFADIFDGTATIQVIFKKDTIGDVLFTLLVDAVDASDFIEVTGTIALSKTNQESIVATSWRMLAKSIRPVPDEWFGIKDEDERYRKRYLDMLLSDETRAIVYKRALFWKTIRNFLEERGYIAVETPILENTTGGADARPFVTHHNALDMDVYLRISAGELWQKKLMVAGIPKVYEIGRIFRNEGMSAEHLQDYTQMECYEAYSDYHKGMEMIKEMYQAIAKDVFGTSTFTIHGHTVHLDGEWTTYNFCDELIKQYGIDPLATTTEAVIDALTAHHIPFDKKEINLERGVDLLWKKIRKGITGPGFLIGIPVYLEPLAKKSAQDARVVERFQIVLAGSEVGKGFSELNNPLDQAERFTQQQALRDKGDAEAQMADWEYVEAMEYGMPPTFGFGVSERLFAFLMDKPVRETQLFPLMRPRE